MMSAMTDSRREAFPVPAPVDDLRRAFERVADGDPEALELVYSACSAELYGLALWRTGSPADASDVVQEVFVRLAGTRRDLGGVRDPRAWLRRTTHRAAIDVHRRRARRREESLEACAFLEAAGETAERSADAGRVSALLTRLPAAQREAIYLRHFAGCSFAEIGRATGVPTFTAASRYRLGVRRLQGLMGVTR